MTPPSEKTIFLAALEKETAQERAAFLAEVGARDPRLRAEVEKLLEAHARPGNLLDEVPAEVGAVRAQLEAATDLDGRPCAERPGTVIGPYRLLEQIGEGGFGLVFVAQQQQPVKRKVALKVLKPGMEQREVIARFEAERQALALMDHPNIAQVLDGGATASGRPYFVMELVRGIPITEFCDQNHLPVRERLELFVSVCQAVQHAHQKGIIHRDLKPSNVLVTLQGTPVVKVIDFGVAKAIGQQLTEKTIYTRFAQIIGTPLYMSPEQAELSGLDVDTRSDIYSLGVLLYELLTGTTPFDRQRMRTAAFDEVRRIIREEEPPRPSTRLSQLRSADCGMRIAKKRGVLGFFTPHSALRDPQFQDLDWIVMKALEKERSRRYETAAAFAADVRRFLNEEPVEARPPSSLYRFRKLARRNKVALTTVALVAAALVAGTAVSIWQAARASSARAEADASRQRAEDFAERLKQANVLLDNARAHAGEQRWGPAYARYTKAAQLQPDHYLVWSGRGSLYVRLGLWQRAASDYARALALGAPANNPGWWGVPQLFLYTAHEQSYREACGQMLRQHGKTSDRLWAAVMIRSCLVSPAPVTDAAALARRAEELLAEMPNWPPGPFFGGGRPPPRPPDRGQGMMWFPRAPGLYLAGLAHYRAGRSEQAINRLRRSLSEDPGWPTREISYPVLALAYHRAGRAREARAALAAAEKVLDRWTAKMVQSPVGTMPIPWFDWIECNLLYREARALITGSVPPADPRQRTLEQRALAALESSS
jgi:serine/threonine protein kinase